MRGSAARIDRKAVDSPDIIVPSPGRAVNGESRFVRFRTRFVKNGGASNGAVQLVSGLHGRIVPTCGPSALSLHTFGGYFKGFYSI